MERRVRPWINKKIIEYIGEEEPTLVEFVCSKVSVPPWLKKKNLKLDFQQITFIMQLTKHYLIIFLHDSSFR